MNKLEQLYFDKVRKASDLYLASVLHLSKVNIETLTTPDDLEKLDAFISRFERLIEIILSKLTKTIELIENWINEWTLRDRLNLLEKLWLISTIDLWLEMRGVRNKMAHDYLENTIFEFYYIILKKYHNEILYFFKSLDWYKERIK